MQGFEAKKRPLRVYFFLVPYTPYSSISHNRNPSANRTRYDGWKLSTITTSLCCLQQCNDKMYLNQMYEKKVIQGYASMWLPTRLLHDQLVLKFQYGMEYGMEDFKYGMEENCRYGIWKKSSSIPFHALFTAFLLGAQH